MRKAGYGVLLVTLVALASNALADRVTHKSGFWGKTVRGSGEMTTETRDVGSFTRIESDGAFDITVRFGPTQKVTLTFDDNLIDQIETKVHGRTLDLSSEGSWSSHENCKVEITVTALDRISISGSGEIEIIDMKAEEFEFEQSGSGTFTASGTCGDLNVDLSGSGSIHTVDLAADNVTVTISGSGDAEVFAKVSLEAEVSGSGSIEYYGSPENVSSNVSGSGRITKRK